MPPKSGGAAKWPGRQAGEEPGAIRAAALRSEDAPAAAPAAAQPDGAQGAWIDDLFSKTLTRLQLGPEKSSDRSPERKPQRRQNQLTPGAHGGRSSPEVSNDEQPGADPLRGWAQKVLLTGPSPSERRQDLLEIVDTTLDPRRHRADQDRLQIPRRALSRCSSKGSSYAPNTSRRATRSGSKLGGPRQSWRPPEISPASDDADNPAASPWSATVGGSSPTGLPPSPFKRSTREALKEGMDREVTNVFEKLAVEYEIESCELLQALVALGHRRPREEWMDEILEKSYGGRSYLDKGDFAEFVEAYRARFLEDIGEKYRSSDLYNNGSLSMMDLSNMLRHEGIHPLPGMIRELFTELLKANPGGMVSGGSGFEEYLRIYDIVHERGGFTRAALIRLHVTFQRFDGNADGRLTESEVKAALRWLGLEAFADEDPSEGDEEATAYAKGGLSQVDFLSLVSRCHEREVSAVNSAFAGRDAKLSGCVNIRDLPAIFEDLGYPAATPQVCREACAACNSQDASSATQSGQNGGESGAQLSVRRTVSGWGRARMAFAMSSDKQGESDSNNLTLVQMMDTPGGTSSSLQWRRLPKDLLFEDFYAVVDQVRDTHCLSCSERAEAVEAFDLHCAEKAQGISLVEMTKAVRWIGYPVHLGRLLEIFDESDLHDTYRRRDAQEFMRLVARIRADEVRCVRARMKKGPLQCTCGGAGDEDSDACDLCASERWGCGLLLVSSFGVLLGELGHCASWEQVERLREAAGGGNSRIPLWSALQLLEQHRKEERGGLRNNQSFSDSEVRRFQQRFQRLEGGAQGAVKRREIFAAVDQLVGRKRRCERLAAIARDVLQKTDPTQSAEARPPSTPSTPAHSDVARGRRNSSHSTPVVEAVPVSKVDLPELLKIMRMLHDQDDEARLEKEQSIVREVGFSREEVREFRRLFHQASLDSEYRLTLLELEKLVARVMPVTKGMQEEFKSMAMRAACVTEEALDFGSFLAVMRNLVDQNWHNINEASETALAAAKAKARARTSS